MSDRHELRSLRRELDLWGEAGRMARLWLRDDDAVAPTEALDALVARLRAHGVPCLLAVIPMLSTTALAERLAGEPLVRVAMHGVRHENHAPAGRKTEETPDERGAAAISSELAAARGRFVSLFGEEAGAWYVPPWNRIGPVAAGLLRGLGFRAISTFGSRPVAALPGLGRLDAHVDLMDWKGGRVGRPLGAVAMDLAAALAMARRQDWRPVGLLGHHLVHDAEAWAAIDALLDLVARHDAAEWRAADDLVGDACPAGPSAT